MNEAPSEEYILEGQQIAMRQIAKGGYRLARVIIQIFEHIDKKREARRVTE